MSLEFGLVMRRHNIQDEFDDELYFWSQAIIEYCDVTQKKCVAIQAVLKTLDGKQL